MCVCSHVWAFKTFKIIELGKTVLKQLLLFTPQVLVTKNVNGLQKTIRKMGEGEHFGELALIRYPWLLSDSVTGPLASQYQE